MHNCNEAAIITIDHDLGYIIYVFLLEELIQPCMSSQQKKIVDTFFKLDYMHTASSPPHPVRAFRRGLDDVVTSAEISDAVCIFSCEYLSETAKSN